MADVAPEFEIASTTGDPVDIRNITGTVVLPSGAATAALQTTGNSSLSSIDSKTPTLVAGRQPVDGSGVTQPISATSLPLPTGAATSALQTTGNTSLSSIDSKTPTLVSGRQPVEAVGNAASGASDSGNPVKIGNVFNTTLPTVTNGQRVDGQANRYGEHLIVRKNLYRNIAGAATTTVKSGAGRLSHIVVNTTINGSITIYDNTAGSGTKIATIATTNGVSNPTLSYDCEFSTGLTIVTTGANLDITVMYY